MSQKLLLFYLLLAFLSFSKLNAQQQPVSNSSFENWGTTTLPFQVPSASPTKSFETSNSELVNVNLTNVTKITNGGGSAMRLQTISYTGSNGLDTSVAYAIWGGSPQGGSLFSGGFPFIDQNVTGIKMDLRYNINALSPGLVIVQFKKNGVAIGGNTPSQPGIYTFPVSGSQGTFTSTTFTFSPALSVQPDTCIIAFTSNNPFDQTNPDYPGDYMEVDNVALTGTSLTVPVGDLDTWINATTELLPVSWTFGDGTSGGGEENKTSDAHTGADALRLSVIDDGGGGKNVERINLGTVSYGNPNTYKPGYALTGRPQSLGFYYKYSTPGVDSAGVYVRLTKWNSGTNSRDDVGSIYTYALPQASYTYAYASVSYMNGNTPDSAYVEFSASNNWNTAVFGSVLTLDDITFNYCNENLTISGSTNVAVNSSGVAYSVNETEGATYTWSAPAGATISGNGTSNILVDFSGTGGAVYVNKTYSDGCPAKSATLNVTIQSTSSLDNGGFENWAVRTLPYQIPAVNPPTKSFDNSNSELVSYNLNLTNMTQIVNGAGSAMRLQTISFTGNNGLDTTMGYAIWGQGPQGNNSLFGGGFPFTDQNVTGIKMDLRYSINALSPGLVIVQFKKNGVAIGGNTPSQPGIYVFPVSGSQGTFTSTTFTFSPALAVQPDTCIIGFTSNNPFDGNIPQYPGDYLEVDNLEFTGTTQVVPGGNLDTWINATTDELPVGWNLGDNSQISGNNKTTDAHAGNYAAELTVIDYGGGNKQVERINMGTTVNNGNSSIFIPGYAVTGRPQSLGFYYKYSTPGVDSASVSVRLTKWNSGTNSRDDVGSAYIYMLPQASYTFAYASVSYMNGNTPDSAYVEFDASKNWNLAVAGSTLKLDDVTFNYCSEVLSIAGSNEVCPNATGVVYSVSPTTGSTYTWTIPAGASITSGSGTNSITVTFGAVAGTIDVTKTYIDGCSDTNASLIVTNNGTASANSGSDFTMCANSVGVLNGSVTGAAGGIWSAAGGGTFTPDNTTLNATFTPSATQITTGTATLTLTTTGNGACSSANDQVVITITPAPTVNASSDQAVCANNANVTLAGSVTIASGGEWTGGSGTFTPNANALNAVYAPSASEITEGTVTLTLTTSGNGGCTAVSDQMSINVNPAPDAGLIVTQVTPICSGVNGTVTIASSQSGVSYQAFIGGSPVSVAVNGTGGNINLSILSTNLTAGSNTITIQASKSGCAVVNLTNTASIVVNAPATPSIVLGDVSKTFGDAPFAIAATSNSAGAFTYSFVSSTPANLVTVTSDGNVTINGAGTATVKVDQAIAGCFTSGSQTATITIAKASRTATVTAANTGTVDGTVSLTNTVSAGTGTATWSVVNGTGAATISGTTLTCTGAGTVTVTVTIAADANYNSTSANQIVTISKANRTASVTSTNSSAVGGTINLTNTVSAGAGAATWSVANGTGAATVSGTTLTMTGAGTVTVTVNIAADANYNATSATQIVTIGKGNRTATITSANSGTLNGTINLTNTVSAGTGAATWTVSNVTGSATLSGTILTLTGAGDVTVTVNIAADVNYNATSATQTITINKANRTATITSANTGTVDGMISLTNTVSAGTGAVTWSVVNGTGSATVSGTTLTLTDAGTVDVTVNIAADANYNATSAMQTITIGKADRTVSITSSGNGSISTNINLTNTTSPSGGTATWSVTDGTGSATLSGTTLSLVSAGTVTVRVDIASDANYNAAFATQVITISTMPTPNVTFGDVSKTFGDASFNLTATSNSSGAFTYSLVSSTPSGVVTVASDGSVTINGAGTATVKVDQAANGSFDKGSANATITIGKATRTASVTSSNSGTVDGTINLTNSISGGDGNTSWTVTDGTGSATLSGSTLTLTGAGTVTVTVDIAADANYNATSANQIITIAKGTRTVAITSASSGLVNSTMTLTYSSSPSGGTATWSIVDGTGSATLSGTSLSLVSIGTVTVTVDIAADANYNAATANMIITINETQTPQPGDFTQSMNTVTQGEMGVSYTVPNEPGTTYTWSFTGGNGVTINGSGNSVTLDFSSSATSGTLSVIADDGSGPSVSRDLFITVTISTGIATPVGATLRVYPNPFETTSFIEFDLQTGGDVDLEVYDLLGHKMMSIIKGETLAAGSHTVSLSDLNSGSYIVKLKIGNTEKNIKVIKN